MSIRSQFLVLTSALAAVIVVHAAPLGTAFTYQGRLQDSGSAANGVYDFRFAVYDAASGANQVGLALTNSAVAISNGLFTAALDFGSNVWSGSARWLDLAVRASGSGSGFTPLTSRQALTPAPYALYALTPAGPPGPKGADGIQGPPGPSVVSGTSAAPVISGTNLGSGPAVQGSAGDKSVLGLSTSGAYGYLGGAVFGVYGYSPTGSSVYGTNAYGHALRGDSGGNIAVLGINGGASSDVGGNGGVYGLSGSGFGIGGESTSGDGVLGSSQSGYAGHFYGKLRASGLISSDAGVQATNAYGHALRGDSGGNIAVLGINGGASSDVGGNGGVYGLSGSGFGIGGESTSGDGVLGSSQSGYAGHFYGPLKATGVISSDAGLNVAATHTGAWNAAVGYLENQNSGANSAPALRVVANGNAPYGALSVSTQGTGLIAQFGNAAAWVAQLDANGNWNATSFNPTSDRNAKEHFREVDPREVLEKVAGLSITRWNFKTDATTDHVGPMAQEFYAAFELGADDKHIATVDADGVALAAIQGLNQKLTESLQEKDAQIQALAKDLAELKAQMKALGSK